MDLRLEQNPAFVEYQNLVSTYNILNAQAAKLTAVFEMDCEQLEGVDADSVGNECWIEGMELLEDIWAETKDYGNVGIFAATRARFWAAVWGQYHMTREEKKLRENQPFFA
ncbi:MAG: hypothetical protein ABNH38_04890 [Tateyamaria sp.]|jgi:hypothetical protein|uniref:hypothetical protein n=1 Tax=Tateyamaria sp. TaxID=1929288 RepID=UPI0032DE1A26